MVTKEMLKRIREDINSVLAIVGEKYNMEIKLGNISYSEDEWHGKIQAKEILSEDKQAEKAKQEWNRFCRIYGFEPEDYRKTFEYKGKSHTLIGFETSRRKYPVLVEDETGKRTLFTTDIKKLI